MTSARQVPACIYKSSGSSDVMHNILVCSPEGQQPGTISIGDSVLWRTISWPVGVGGSRFSSVTGTQSPSCCEIEIGSMPRERARIPLINGLSFSHLKEERAAGKGGTTVGTSASLRASEVSE